MGGLLACVWNKTRIGQYEAQVGGCRKVFCSCYVPKNLPSHATGGVLSPLWRNRFGKNDPMLFRRARPGARAAIRNIIGPEIRAGGTYPLDRGMSEADALACWLGPDKETRRLCDGQEQLVVRLGDECRGVGQCLERFRGDFDIG